MAAAVLSLASGSSPLARGLLVRRQAAQVLLRIIPARAGFTDERDHAVLQQADHPRSRGVYSIMAIPKGVINGSSPLARGLLDGVVLAVAGEGIIPARAGFTRTTGRSLLTRWDHPRSRGVYVPVHVARKVLAGSSPLARGLLWSWITTAWNGRIIPARAGFTHSRCGNLFVRWDHPRSRGVYAARTPRALLHAGSSPLARGLRSHYSMRCPGDGIIPARAGFTWDVRACDAGVADHPRSRGVYHDKQGRKILKAGSSPLARGLLLREGQYGFQLGIIPARAGFTTGHQTAGFIDPGGSSPLARGLLEKRRHLLELGGIIPARAGFTNWSTGM